MKFEFDCYGCVTRGILKTADAAGADPEQKRLIANELLRKFIDSGAEMTPPEMMAFIVDVQQRETGIIDQYAEEKRKSTELGLLLLEELRPLAAASCDPFAAAVKLAIGGNIIDYGANPDFCLAGAGASIRSVLEQEVDKEALELLRKKMTEAGSIFYMLDNCGEAVIDRLLIEQFRDKITIGVRGKPVLNDVTRADAAASGLGDLPIVDTATNIPGVSLRHSSAEFLAAMNAADLVICKGQGNFESLYEDIRQPAFFLLRIKCQVVARHLNAPLGSIQIISANIN